MAQEHDGTIFALWNATETFAPYRRVKYDGSTAGTVQFADASDDDSWIGVTVPELIDVSSAQQITIKLRAENVTLKIEASAAITANASIYPENDGKISDDAGTVVIGTAAGVSVASGSGSIVEVHPNGGSGSATSPSTVAIESATDGTIPIHSHILATDTGTTEIPLARKVQLIDAWAFQRGTTATNANVLVDATTATRTDTDMGTTADVRKQLEITDAAYTVAAASTLYASISTDEPTGVEFHVLCIPVA